MFDFHRDKTSLGLVILGSTSRVMASSHTLRSESDTKEREGKMLWRMHHAGGGSCERRREKKLRRRIFGLVRTETSFDNVGDARYKAPMIILSGRETFKSCVFLEPLANDASRRRDFGGWNFHSPPTATSLPVSAQTLGSRSSTLSLSTSARRPFHVALSSQSFLAHLDLLGKEVSASPSPGTDFCSSRPVRLTRTTLSYDRSRLCALRLSHFNRHHLLQPTNWVCFHYATTSPSRPLSTDRTRLCSLFVRRAPALPLPAHIDAQQEVDPDPSPASASCVSL